MIKWYLLAGNEPEELRKSFIEFFTSKENYTNLALWKWKSTFWICAEGSYHQELIKEFHRFNIIEFMSAPTKTDIEFIYGDKKLCNNHK